MWSILWVQKTLMRFLFFFFFFFFWVRLKTWAIVWTSIRCWGEAHNILGVLYVFGNCSIMTKSIFVFSFLLALACSNWMCKFVNRTTVISLFNCQNSNHQLFVPYFWYVQPFLKANAFSPLNHLYSSALQEVSSVLEHYYSVCVCVRHPFLCTPELVFSIKWL